MNARTWLRRLLPPLGLTALLLLLMLWLAGAFRRRQEPGPFLPDARPSAAGGVRVESREFVDYVEQVGTIRSRYQAEVASKLLAQVVALEVEAGDRVVGPEDPQGPTAVARLDARDLTAGLARAEAQARAAARGVEVQQAELSAARARLASSQARLDKAEADLRRAQALVEQGITTPEQLDQARAERDVALADLAAARDAIRAAEQRLGQAGEEQVVAQRAVEEATVLLGYTALSAPFTGLVAERLVEVGDMLQPGQGVIRLEDPTRLELHADVAETLAAELTLGQELPVRVDSLGRDLPGKVREVSPAADPDSRTVRVKVALEAVPGLKSGLFGRLLVPVGRYRALVVPRAAVRRVGQLDLVDAVSEGRLQRRFVTLGRAHAEDVEVLSGLDEGEQVVLP